MYSHRLLIQGLAACAILYVTFTPATHAANFTVTKTEDTNDGVCDADCSLREAVIAANKTDEEDSIILPAGTYPLSIAGADEDNSATGDLDITRNLNIIGTDAETTSIAGVESLERDRVLHIVSPEFPNTSGPTVKISGVTIRNGDASSIRLPAGGGIFNQGILELTDSAVMGNRAAIGGGIGNAATLASNHSTISSNIAIEGGGIANIGVATLTNTILSDNRANNGSGGGILNVINILTLNSSTVSHNTATNIGGGIGNVGATLNLVSSTVSGNTANGPGGGIANAGLSITPPIPFGEDGSTKDSFDAVANLIDSTANGNIAEDSGAGIANGLIDHALQTEEERVLQATIERTFRITVEELALTAQAELTLTRSTLSNNEAANDGGGLLNNALATLTNSTVNDNEAANDGGGIHTSGTARLTNSTVSTNEAHRNGGGIANSGGAVNLNNVTIADNVADSDSVGGGDGGGVFNEVVRSGEFTRTGPVNFSNTLIVRNVDNGGQGPDCFGSLISQQFNIVQDPTGCFFDRTNNKTGEDPDFNLALGPLADNGGPTLSHALLDGSSAIDAGNPDGCTDDLGTLLTIDQRGVGRPPETDEIGVGEVCDIGAYERMLPTADLFITKDDSPDPVVVGSELTYLIRVTNNGPSAATEVSVKDILPADVVPVSATSTRGPCRGGCEVNCPLGTVERGDSVTVTIVIKPTRVRTVINTATVSGVEFDPDMTNNATAETPTTVIPPAQLSQASLTLRPVADFPDDPRLAYVLIGSPLHLAPSDPFALLRPPLGPFGVNLWRLFRFVPDPADLPDRGEYRELPRDGGNDPFFAFVPGRGFWLIARNGGTVTFTGDPPDVSRSFEIPLDPGPQQIATPFNFPEGFTIDWSECVVPSLPEGVSASLFDFAGTAGGYFMQGALAPMHGYWVCNETDLPVTLSIAPECVRQFDAAACPVRGRGSALNVPTPQRANFLSGWRVKLSVAVGAVKDTENYLGVDVAGQDGHDRLDYTDPPPIHGLSLFFPHPEWNGTWPYYASDIRGVSTGIPQVWNFEVEAHFHNEEVQLKWDLDGVAGEGFTLRDVEAGQVVNMGQTNVYTYNSGRGGVRHFRVMTE